MSALHDYLAHLEALPAGSLVPAHGLAAELRQRLPEPAAPTTTEPAAQTWRERLWLVPAETRLGVVELAEALGRPRSWVYRRTGPSTEHARLPCRRLDGELVFIAGEIRAWLAEHEAVEHTLAPRVVPIAPRRRAG
jgi:predicted DNA-binding transcriptional regulator AlpA